MRKLIPLALMVTFAASAEAQVRKISVEEYRKKVYGSWLGQLIGNIYGLPHENKYIGKPGPDEMPYGYREVKRMQDANGAFSDDDTDFEYMYLVAMEKYGIEPTYEQLAGLWKYHVRDKVWIANRSALATMHYGYTPPVTGLKSVNPHWFQIDPQLINEIWAVTAPGMVRYAAQKSDWGARITNDSWGVEATVHYGAMYAAAFFENDVNKLIDIGTQALPPGSRFAKTVADMKALYRKYPNDWKTARAEMAAKYYTNEPAATKTIWNANLNGAAGILALLYGQGDFQKTLDMSCWMGFDADNQAATMAGLIGLMKGPEGIPSALLFPLKDRDWTKPFNDVYKNVSRHDLPDASINEMTARMAAVGEKIVLAHGGKKVTEDGKEYLVVNPSATFEPPLELPVAPVLVVDAGKAVSHRYPVSGMRESVRWSMVSGKLPAGMSVSGFGNIAGVAKEPGIYSVKLKVVSAKRTAEREYPIVVVGPNLAPQAAEVLAAVRQSEAGSVEKIRDGKTSGEGSAYSSKTTTEGPREDFYGYKWAAPQTIGTLIYYQGFVPNLDGYWLKVPVVEYSNGGEWQAVKGVKVGPPVFEGPEPYDKPSFTKHVFTFEPVTATQIRVRGQASGERVRFTSVAEVTVHGPLANPEQTEKILR